MRVTRVRALIPVRRCLMCATFMRFRFSAVPPTVTLWLAAAAERHRARGLALCRL